MKCTSRLQRCHVVLIEDFRNGDAPKLEIWRGALGKPTLWPDWPGIWAIASNRPVAKILSSADKAARRFALHDVATIATFVLDNARPH